MKTILCFGDSNTWGTPPGGVGRHRWQVRWPGVLQQRLGAAVRVLEDGLPGRTNLVEDPSSANRSGAQLLPVALEISSPLDLVIIMLGTNDLKRELGLSPKQIAQGARELLRIAAECEPRASHVLLVSPPHVTETSDAGLAAQFHGGIERSQELAAHYAEAATHHGSHFFDAASVAKSSPVDGIHLDERSHQALGEALAAEAARILAL